MSKIAGFIQPEIEVFVNGYGHIAIRQEECEQIGNHADQLIVVHTAHAEQLAKLILETLAEAKAIEADEAA